MHTQWVGRIRGTIAGAALILVSGAATDGLAGDLFTDNLTVATNLAQTSSSGTNTFMGPVGIGTASPGDMLHVIGDVQIEGNLTLHEHWLSGDGAAEGLRVLDSGDVVLSDNLLLDADVAYIAPNTSSSADDRMLILTGGGAPDDISRAPNLALIGNDSSSFAGQVWISAGDVAGGDIYLTVGNYHYMITLREDVYAIDLHDNQVRNLKMRQWDYITMDGETDQGLAFGSDGTVLMRPGTSTAGSALRVHGQSETDRTVLQAVRVDNFATRELVLNPAGGHVGVGLTTNAALETVHVGGTGRFDGGIAYVAPLGDIAMGTFTNAP